MLPLGWLTLAATSAARTSSSVSPVPASALRVDLHAHRRLLPAVDRDEPDARHLRDLLREDRVGVVVDLVERQDVRAHASVRIGVSAGLLLLYVGGVGSVRGQEARRRVDRRLHVLLGGVDVAIEVNCSVICELPKLETLVICVERRHLAELPLERRRHGRRHRVGAGAGQVRRDDDRRVVDLRQRGDRQLLERRRCPRGGGRS